MKKADTLETAQREARAILAGLRKLPWSEQYQAIDALETSKNPLTDTVLFRLLEWREAGVRESALGVLEARNKALARVAARALLADTNSCARNAAAEVLGRIGNRQDIRRLRLALADENWVMRATVADSLGLIGGKAVHPTLLHTLAHDPDSVVRRDAAYALSYAKSREVIPALEAALVKEKSLQAPIGILGALTLLGQKEYLPKLLALLDSQDDIVRHATVNMLLAEVRPEDKEEVMEAIRAMIAREPNPGVKGDAETALAAISQFPGRE